MHVRWVHVCDPNINQERRLATSCKSAGRQTVRQAERQEAVSVESRYAVGQTVRHGVAKLPVREVGLHVVLQTVR